MDLKQKFKSLLLKQDSLSGGGSSPDMLLPSQLEGVLTREKVHIYKSNPDVDQEVLSSIGDELYKTQDFNSRLYELENLPADVNLEYIDKRHTLILSQLEVVSRKVSDLILSKQAACSLELERVSVLKEALSTSLALCRYGRKNLSGASSTFTTASLGILANYRKRQQLCHLVSELRTIKTLLSADEHVGRLIADDNYNAAIVVLLECQKTCANYSHFSCIKELSNRLKDTLVLAKEAMDKALAKICVNWDPSIYLHVMEAYGLLGETQAAMDQLHLHVTASILSRAGAVLLEHVKPASSSQIDYTKLPYQDLCKEIGDENYFVCLVDLCNAMFEVLSNYRCILTWHQTSHQTSGELEAGNMEQALSQEYCKQKLSRGPQRVWQDIQSKLAQFLCGLKSIHIKVNDFIHLLDVIHSMIACGENFCDCGSEILEQCLEEQTRQFLAAYHHDQMDDLRAVLENESWEAVPVGRDFSFHKLQEFSFMSGRDWLPARKTSKKREFERRFLNKENPFMSSNHWEPIHSACEEADSDEDVSEELKKGFVEEDPMDSSSTKAHQKQSRIVCSESVVVTSVLTVLRLVGRYVCMMYLLPSTAHEILQLTTQLLDYFFYNMYCFFVQKMSHRSALMMSSQLKDALRRISENLILHEDQSGEIHVGKYATAVVPSLVVELGNDASKGLVKRLVAAETLAFLCSQLHLLYPIFLRLVSNQKSNLLNEYFTNTVEYMPALREPMYRSIVAGIINYDHVITLISQVNWDISDVKEQHNAYVDVLFRELQVFSMLLDEAKGEVYVPGLWNDVMYYSALCFLDGFSLSRKVSLEGRSWMLLDWKQFLAKADRFVPSGTHLYGSLVDEYIRAYYIPPDSLQEWIHNRKEYSAQHIVGLLNCYPNMNKKLRQQLLTKVDDMHSSYRHSTQ